MAILLRRFWRQVLPSPGWHPHNRPVTGCDLRSSQSPLW
jgi:hypothetical protein